MTQSNAPTAVSYTHLDVYKRQMEGGRSFRVRVLSNQERTHVRIIFGSNN